MARSPQGQEVTMNDSARKEFKPGKLLPHLSTQTLLVIILFCAIFTMAVRMPADSDTYWHLVSGRYIVENRTVPTTDPFSFTRQGEMWIDHGWLGQVLLYALYALGGWTAVALLVAVIVTAAFYFIYRQCEGNAHLRAFGIIIGAITSSVIWAARPQLVSFLLTAIVTWLLYHFKHHGGRLLPWLPLMTLVWVNVHGGFAIAFIILLCYGLGEAVNHLTSSDQEALLSKAQWQHLGLAALLSLVTIGINPHTWRMWVYPFQTVGMAALRDYIIEWQSPNFHLAWQQPFILLLLLTVLALARAGKRADFTDLALLAAWTAWALFAGRNIAIFALVATPIFIRYASIAWERQLEDWRRSPKTAAWLERANKPMADRGRLSALNWLLLVLIVAAALLKISMPLAPQAIEEATRESMPVDAVAYIQQMQPDGPMYNSYNWGGYLMFKLWPDYPVFVDGRTDLYGDDFMHEYISIYVANEGWQALLDAHDIQFAIIEQDSVLAKFLKLSSDWQEVFRDDMAVIFTRP
jgi:hypothetical protein